MDGPLWDHSVNVNYYNLNVKNQRFLIKNSVSVYGTYMKVTIKI